MGLETDESGGVSLSFLVALSAYSHTQRDGQGLQSTVAASIPICNRLVCLLPRLLIWLASTWLTNAVGSTFSSFGLVRSSREKKRKDDDEKVEDVKRAMEAGAGADTGLYTQLGIGARNRSQELGAQSSLLVLARLHTDEPLLSSLSVSSFPLYYSIRRLQKRRALRFSFS